MIGSLEIIGSNCRRDLGKVIVNAWFVSFASDRIAQSLGESYGVDQGLSHRVEHHVYAEEQLPLLVSQLRHWEDKG